MFDELVRWSKKEFSSLPWRNGRTTYSTLISEFMLQQTTVSTVINHYHLFLKTFPNIHNLASASEEEVLKKWKGLGYYRRARNLHKAAVDIMQNHCGNIPMNYKALVKISGIGEYTANAILSIGYNQPILALDSNVERVLSRIYLLEDIRGLHLKKRISSLFDQKKIVKQIMILGGRALNEALMDLGRIHCRSHKTNCISCPVKDNCQANMQNITLKYPIANPIKKNLVKLELLRIVVINKDKILAYRKNDNEWLSGQLELPTFIIKTEDKSLKQYPWFKKKIDLKKLKSFKTTITKYKIDNYILISGNSVFKYLISLKRYRYFPLNLKEEHYSTASVKALNKI